MKTRILFTALLGLALGGVASAADDKAAAAATRVTVTFEDTENFTDFRQELFDRDADREHLQTRITEMLAKAAQPYLPAGQKLEVHFTDIDLAGDFEPWRGPSFDRIRVIKDIYPPRMAFTFRVTDADGKIVSEGTRNLRDMGFMMSIRLNTLDSLRHEKEMIDQWVRQEFRRPAKTTA